MDLNIDNSTWTNIAYKNVDNRRNTMKDIFDFILNIIIILLTILVVYWLIQLILGGIPDLNQVNFGLILILSSLYVKLHREVGEIKVEAKHINIEIKNVSSSIKEGFSKIKADINEIKNKIK